MIKSGTMEKTEQEIREEFRPINRMTAQFKGGLRFDFMFVTSKQRSFGDHQLVRKQTERRGSFGRYSKSLLDSMFSNW
ncbi:hypothetical protein [Pseudobacillus badius]|uniref:hypothetical protein n=1 Tax=Bacillus badius TaxID=1455 RepID=UPI0024A2A1DB|nr:hypothetical protein [Bacillus badius]GLY09574.1 hypothetical protein Bbad01_07900 [Bacillus badius]